MKKILWMMILIFSTFILVACDEPVETITEPQCDDNLSLSDLMGIYNDLTYEQMPSIVIIWTEIYTTNYVLRNRIRSTGIITKVGDQVFVIGSTLILPQTGSDIVTHQLLDYRNRAYGNVNFVRQSTSQQLVLFEVDLPEDHQFEFFDLNSDEVTPTDHVIKIGRFNRINYGMTLGYFERRSPTTDRITAHIISDDDEIGALLFTLDGHFLGMKLSYERASQTVTAVSNRTIYQFLHHN